MKEEKDNLVEFIKKSKYSIIIISLFALFAFGERIISNSISIDTELYIHQIGIAGRWDWWISLNRWGLVILNKFFQMDSLPIFASNYVTVILMIAYSVVFNYLFYINIKEEYKDKFIKYQFIFPIIFITNPIFAEQYNFILQNVSLAFSILMVPCILLLINKASDTNNKIQKAIYYILSLIILVFIFGVYQSVILLYIVTVVVCYLLKVLKEENNCWRFLVKQIGIFMLAAIIYFIIGKVLSEASTSYLQSAWFEENIKQCLKNILVCIKSVLKCETIFYNFGYILSILISLTSIIYLAIKKKLKIGVVIATIGLLLAPFYIMFITGVDQLKRTQFNYSFVIGFIMMLTVVFLSNKEKLKYIRNITIIVVLIIAYTQSYITANLFHTVDMVYKSDEVFAHRLVQKIEEKQWYEKGKYYTLIFVGKHCSDLKNVYLKSEVIGSSFFEFDYQYIYGVNSRAHAFLNILGYKFRGPSEEKFEKAKKYVEENKIKSWPSEESVVLINEDTIIVRLSEEY